MTHSALKRFLRLRNQGKYIRTLERKIMQINSALKVANVQAATDKKTISDDAQIITDLKAEVAAGVDPVAAKALVDTVMGTDTANLPEPPTT